METDFQYEWDADKAVRNLQKHGVAFQEAATIFDDPMFITVVDDEHSVDEERYISIVNWDVQAGTFVADCAHRSGRTHSYRQCARGNQE